SEEHTSELQSRENLVCRLLLEKKHTEHGRPRTGDHQIAALAFGQALARLVDHVDLDARPRQGARTRLESARPRQRGDDMPAGYGLPPGIDHRATACTDLLVIPDPGLGIDGLAH